MRLARGRQADLRGRDATAAGGADAGRDRRPDHLLHGRRVRGDADPRLLPASQFLAVPAAHQVLPHVDHHERADADAGVRDQRRAAAGNPARGESAVYGVRRRRYMLRLQSQTERGRGRAGRRRSAGSGTGRGQRGALCHVQEESATEGLSLPLVPDLRAQQGIPLQMVRRVGYFLIREYSYDPFV